MKYQHLLIRSFLLSLLIILMSACSQHSESNKERISVEPPQTVKQLEIVEPEIVEPEVVEPEVVAPEVVEPEVIAPVVEEPVLVTPIKKESKPLQISISGQIELDQNQIRSENAQVDKTVIYFQANNLSENALNPKTYNIVTENKRFKPDVLAITQGSTVQFPVKDTILHNVFSVTPGNSFDLGLYSEGTTKNHVFNEPGIVYVHCNVHHAMQADIIVLNTPYFTYADSSGHYKLTGLPNTAGTLHFWHPRGQQLMLDITQLSAINTINKTLIITRPKVPKHSNKFGKSYRPTRN